MDDIALGVLREEIIDQWLTEDDPVDDLRATVVLTGSTSDSGISSLNWALHRMALPHLSRN
jgi:hypothetical protein